MSIPCALPSRRLRDVQSTRFPVAFRVLGFGVKRFAHSVGPVSCSAERDTFFLRKNLLEQSRGLSEWQTGSTFHLRVLQLRRHTCGTLHEGPVERSAAPPVSSRKRTTKILDSLAATFPNAVRSTSDRLPCGSSPNRSDGNGCWPRATSPPVATPGKTALRQPRIDILRGCDPFGITRCRAYGRSR